MKKLISSVASKLRRRSPVVLTASAMLYELLLGMVDFSTPEEMSFAIFYLLGVAFVGWGAGTRAAVLVSAFSALLMAFHERIGVDTTPWSYGIVVWNLSTRFLLFCTAGWLTSEVTRLNRHLQILVASRTRQLESETEKHKATSAQLGETLSRLKAIIAGVPIIIFAVDRKGIITFEDGRALAALGSHPGEHVGRSVQDAYGVSKQTPEHMRRALAGEEFSGLVEIGLTALETWYVPTREADGTISGYTGVAINVTNQRRLERQILEISDREQARIGQEIHDGLCQQLVSLAFDANSLQTELSARKLAEARTAKRMAEYLDQAITEARQLARGLFPIRLDAQGLAPALEELARTTRERFGVACRFESSKGVQVHSKVMATHLYRIAQESIMNAIKHGHARSIDLSLEARTDYIELYIKDDGSGIGTGNLTDRGGMGLHIMDYRARTIGGTFSYGPSEQGGTLISCCVPERHV